MIYILSSQAKYLVKETGEENKEIFHKGFLSRYIIKFL